MPAKGKELRTVLEPHYHAWVIATAKARRTTPGRIVNELIESHVDHLPRMQASVSALEAARKDGDRIGVIRDFIADLYAQEGRE
jgi:hypothetical protein